MALGVRLVGFGIPGSPGSISENNLFDLNSRIPPKRVVSNVDGMRTSLKRKNTDRAYWKHY